MRVRAFAHSEGIKAKTDPIDAVLIADYGLKYRPKPTPAQDHATAALRALSDRRDQLVEDRTRESNRLEACQCQEIISQLRQSIRRLERQIATFEAKIQKQIEGHAHLREKHRLLVEETGIGNVCATVLTVYLTELGCVNRQQIGALAGLAPYPRDSGEYRGKRRIYAGRARIRRALFMSALTAVKYNPVLREMYLRLLADGKKKKVALCACARKLLVYLNSKFAKHLSQPASGGKSPAGA